MAKTKKLFDPNSSAPMPLSRSKIDLFLQCPRCFHLDRKFGISQPSGAPFTLNNTVDLLLKKEFDAYRKNRKLHPFQIKNNINAIPFNHCDVEIWRNNRRGIQYIHEPTNFLITGAIDDVWVLPNGELIIVDYKAKASVDDHNTFLEPKTDKNGKVKNTEQYKISYKKQIEIYQWLFRKNGFMVSNTAYFIFANAKKEKDAFNDRLDFEKFVISYDGNIDWIEPALFSILDNLKKEQLPEANEDCRYCKYRKNAFEHEIKQ
jgi:hypothetical protein